MFRMCVVCVHVFICDCVCRSCCFVVAFVLFAVCYSFVSYCACCSFRLVCCCCVLFCWLLVGLCLLIALLFVSCCVFSSCVC